MIWLRYALLLLIVPSYILALSRRRWTTIPLWLVSTSVMLTQFLMSAQQTNMIVNGIQPPAWMYAGEMAKIMLIPIGVQFAVVLSGMGIGVGNKTEMVSQKLLAASHSGKR